MRNNALFNDANAYPQTLYAAHRIASGWVSENPLGTPAALGGEIETHSAFLADSNFVTKSRDPDKHRRATTTDASGKKKSTSSVTCFVCGEVGHYARECKLKKGEDIAISGNKIFTDGFPIPFDNTSYIYSFNIDGILTSSKEVSPNSHKIKIFPNPSTNVLNINIRL